MQKIEEEREDGEWMIRGQSQKKPNLPFLIQHSTLLFAVVEKHFQFSGFSVEWKRNIFSTLNILHIVNVKCGSFGQRIE